MAFNIASVLKVPESGPNEEVLLRLPLELLRSDERNFYELSDLDSLVANIELVGLQQPIRVRMDGKGGYTIVSGHRRTAALRKLTEENPERWSEVSCIVENDDVSPEMQELRLIYANCSTRKYTGAELNRERARVEELLYKLKEQGVEFPGRMRDHVAQAVGQSKSKLSRLKVIDEKLHDGFRESWEAGKLPESTAYALAQLEDDMQSQIAEITEGGTVGMETYRVENYVKRVGRLPKDCMGCKGVACSHLVTMRRKVWQAASWEATCERCCMDCQALEHCTGSCTAMQCVQDKKARLKAATKLKCQEDKAREAERVAPELEYLSSILARIYGRMQEKGLSVPDLLYDSAGSAEYNLLCGSKKPEPGTRIPLGYGLSYNNCKTLIDAAGKLECSIDWLLTGEGHSTSSVSVPNLDTGWKDTEPDRPGWYVVAYELVPGKMFYSRLYWTGSQFLMRESDPSTNIHASYLRYWIELPGGDSIG